MPFYYTITVQCAHCGCPCPWGVVSEVELPTDTKITIYCPNHGGAIPTLLRHFKRVDELPPGMKARPYPPPPPAPPPKPRWWQFWKW